MEIIKESKICGGMETYQIIENNNGIFSVSLNGTELDFHSTIKEAVKSFNSYLDHEYNPEIAGGEFPIA